MDLLCSAIHEQVFTKTAVLRSTVVDCRHSVCLVVAMLLEVASRNAFYDILSTCDLNVYLSAVANLY